MIANQFRRWATILKQQSDQVIELELIIQLGRLIESAHDQGYFSGDVIFSKLRSEIIQADVDERPFAIAELMMIEWLGYHRQGLNIGEMDERDLFVELAFAMAEVCESRNLQTNKKADKKKTATVEDRQWAEFGKNRDCASWSKAEWAKRLDCSASSVLTKAWYSDEFVKARTLRDATRDIAKRDRYRRGRKP